MDLVYSFLGRNVSGNTLVLIGWEILEGTLVKDVNYGVTVPVFVCAETVTVSACRSETCWLKHNVSYTSKGGINTSKLLPNSAYIKIIS